MDIEWLIHHLCFDENFSKAEIDIDFYDGDQWARLLQGLRRSKLEELQIIRSTQYPRRSEEDLEDMFEVISNISQLHKLDLSDFSDADLSAGHEFFGDFRGVQELEIFISEESGDPISNEVARGIASIPHLSRIHITTPYSFAVSNLFSAHIAHIVVESSDEILEDDHVDLLVEDLTTDRFLRLKTLQLPWLALEKYQIPLFANMLKKNRTLEELIVAFCASDEDDDVDECCQEIIDAMSHNSVLRKFDNRHWNIPQFANRVSSRTEALQTQMLHCNTTLERFDLFEESDASSFTREKDLLLRLNRAGRRRLMNAGEGSVKDWIDVMSHEEVSDDLPSLFHLLRMNPSLCLSYKQLPGNETTTGDNNEDTSRPTKRQCRYV